MARRLFIPAIPPVTPGSFVGSNKLNTRETMPNLSSTIRTVKGAYDAIPQELKDQGVNYVKGKIQDTSIRMGDGMRRGNGGPNYPRQPGNKRSDPQGNRKSGYALTDSPKPQPISLETGLDPRTRVTDFMDAELNRCSPMHTIGLLFQFPTYAGSKLYTYFVNDIAYATQLKSQNNISFNLDLTAFSTTNILSAMNSLCYACQILFYYKSIIAYADKPANNNGGMTYLRRLITPQMLSDLYLLERRLLNTPIPPNLLKLLRYLGGNFAASEMAGCALLKIYPIAPSGTLIDGTAIVTALTNLSTSTNNNVFTLMRRCLPHWIPGQFDDVPVDAVFDKQFTTIFANAPFYSYVTGGTAFVPTVGNSDVPIQYNSFINEIDGMTICLTSIYDTSTTAYVPGFFAPTGTVVQNVNVNTRLSYYTDGTTAKFYPSDSSEFLSKSRVETYKINNAGTGFISPHLMGSSNVLGITGNNIIEIGLKAIDYLMSIDQIKVDARNYYFNANKGQTRNRSRGN